jgi:hypothetical protein
LAPGRRRIRGQAHGGFSRRAGLMRVPAAVLRLEYAMRCDALGGSGGGELLRWPAVPVRSRSGENRGQREGEVSGDGEW